MSNTKKIKQKTTGFDIMYRVVTALACLAIYPVFYFADLLVFAIAHTDISDALNLFTQEQGTLHVTEDSVSLATLPEFIDLFSPFVGDGFDFKTGILQNELYRPLVVAAVFIAIALVIGLVILGFAIFSNKIKVIIGLSGAGFVSCLAALFSFNALANPLISGEIALSDLLSIDGFIANLIVGLLGDVETFALGGAFWGLMFLMLGICAWSVSVLVVNIGEEKEKAMKKAAKEHK